MLLLQRGWIRDHTSEPCAEQFDLFVLRDVPWAGLRGCLLSRLGGFLLIVDPGQVHRRGDGSRRHGVHLGPATQGGLSEVYSTARGLWEASPCMRSMPQTCAVSYQVLQLLRSQPLRYAVRLRDVPRLGWAVCLCEFEVQTETPGGEKSILPFAPMIHTILCVLDWNPRSPRPNSAYYFFRFRSVSRRVAIRWTIWED